MNMRLRRLQSDYEAVRRLARQHKRLTVEGVSGSPPERYRLGIAVRSLRERGEQVVVATEHRVEIWLPAGYPRDPPVCRMLTPVFHPNIAPHAICVGDHWTAAESLDRMIQRIGEMLAFQSYNVKSPLNGRAARWVEEHLHLLPIDKEEFFHDLFDAPPSGSPSAVRACSNCGRTGVPLTSCGGGHDACPECDAQCPTCGALLCLACGRTACPECDKKCANCGASRAENAACASRHALCADCGAACPACARRMCLMCGEPPCGGCAAV